MAKTTHNQTDPQPKDNEILAKIFEDYKGSVFAVAVIIGEGGTVDMVQGGNKKITLPTTSTIKDLTFGQIVAQGVQDLLQGQVMAQVHQLISEVIDHAGEHPDQ